MIELITFWLAGFCTGVAFTGGLAGWLRRRMGPPKGSYGSPRSPSNEVTYWGGYKPLPKDNTTTPPPTDP